MKSLKHIIILLGCSIITLLQGCESREVPQIETNEVSTLTIDINGAGTRTLSSVYEDYTIERLRIFAIDEYGKVENNEYADNLAIESSSTIYSFDVIASPRKRLFVIVNEPTSLTDRLDNVSSQSELTMIEYQIAESLNNELFAAGGSIAATNRLLPMSASTEVDASRDKIIAIHVDRVVARVDLMVDKDELAHTTNVEFNSDTKVNINGLYYHTTLFEPSTPPTPTTLENINDVALGKKTVLELEDPSRNSAQRLLSFYIAERTYDCLSPNRIMIHIDNISLDGVSTEIDATITLGLNGSTPLDKISRNFIYRIYATYNGELKSLEVHNEYAIKAWETEELDGDIEGVMLSITDRVVMDWARLNGTFTAKAVAFGSNRSIEFFLPTSYDISTDTYSYKRCEIVAMGGITYDLRDMSQFGIADHENYLRSIDWLTDARLVFENMQSGHFEFTYQLGNQPDHQDKVAIQITSANVRKELTVIYDNGYVPGALLQENDKVGCWGGAPNGIVFSKRGDGLHPLTTEDVLLKGSDGLYDGDIKIEANKLDDYCKKSLGKRWYAPNKDQLADIQRHVVELGTSYRYNNATGSHYWSSESPTTGHYWSINFTKGLSEPAANSEPETTLRYVRCIANI